MKILVVRFRQMGDAILATSMLSTLKKSFPDAEIHFVLNERIAPLFEGHPAISRIITFSDDERHSFFIYIKKVWHIVHQTRYDAIIDMRSTLNTMFFALFSHRSKWRIGIRKPFQLTQKTDYRQMQSSKMAHHIYRQKSLALYIGKGEG